MGIYIMRCIWECNLLETCVKSANVKYFRKFGSVLCEHI